MGWHGPTNVAYTLLTRPETEVAARAWGAAAPRTHFLFPSRSERQMCGREAVEPKGEQA